MSKPECGLRRHRQHLQYQRRPLQSAAGRCPGTTPRLCGQCHRAGTVSGGVASWCRAEVCAASRLPARTPSTAWHPTAWHPTAWHPTAPPNRQPPTATRCAVAPDALETNGDLQQVPLEQVRAAEYTPQPIRMPQPWDPPPPPLPLPPAPETEPALTAARGRAGGGALDAAAAALGAAVAAVRGLGGGAPNTSSTAQSPLL